MTASDDQRTPDFLEALRASVREELEQCGGALEHVLCAARLAVLGDDQAYRDWPRAVGSVQAGALAGSIDSACTTLILDLRGSDGTVGDLGLVLEAQAFDSLAQVDQRLGGLLQPTYRLIEAVVLEVSGLLPDDELAEALAEHPELQLIDEEHRLPSLVAPVGLTARSALARSGLEIGSIPVKKVCHIEQLEPELAFDGGRPSERMIDRFASRRGVMSFDDGTMTEVRAVLEEDWRVSVQFDGAGDAGAVGPGVDLVRLGACQAEPLDDHRDFWTLSLARFGVDAQTRLVNQPIMILMSDGQRFSL
jgi:hypothetical protein